MPSSIIQAGLADRALSHNAADTAAAAIERVSEAAGSALDDLAAILRLLRSPDEADRRKPAPGLAQVNGLIASFTHGEQRVRWTTMGKVRSLDAANELTAYRVIQESLTNASKHGIISEAHLTLSYEPQGLVIDVTNPVRGPASESTETPAGTGYGIIGLHERVNSVGGAITAGPRPNGIFHVNALIPYAPRSGATLQETS